MKALHLARNAADIPPGGKKFDRYRAIQALIERTAKEMERVNEAVRTHADEMLRLTLEGASG